MDYENSNGNSWSSYANNSGNSYSYNYTNIVNNFDHSFNHTNSHNGHGRMGGTGCLVAVFLLMLPAIIAVWIIGNAIIAFLT